jgi:hypothetical protein
VLVDRRNRDGALVADCGANSLREFVEPLALDGATLLLLSLVSFLTRRKKKRRH